MLNAEERKTIAKSIKIYSFTILLTTLIETLSRSINGFWEANLVCSFRGDVVLKV